MSLPLVPLPSARSAIEDPLPSGVKGAYITLRLLRPRETNEPLTLSPPSRKSWVGGRRLDLLAALEVVAG